MSFPRRFEPARRLHPTKPYSCYTATTSDTCPTEPGKSYAGRCALQRRCGAFAGKRTVVDSDRLRSGYADPPVVAVTTEP